MWTWVPLFLLYSVGGEGEYGDGLGFFLLWSVGGEYRDGLGLFLLLSVGGKG